VRIGITMLSHDQTWGGPGVYTMEIVRSLLAVDKLNEYVLIYPQFGRTREGLGQYSARHSNVEEVLTGRSVSLGTVWEQTAVPRAASKHGLDVLFNPFWSVPVRARYKTVMIVHNTEYHTIPGVYDLRTWMEWTLHNYIWIHRADAVISISKVITEDLVRYVKLPRDRIHLIYHGCSDRFRVIRGETELEATRRKYNLPEKFLLYVGMIFPQKNFGNLLRAYALLKDTIPHPLLVIGKPRWKFDEDIKLVETLGLGDRVRFLGHVPNEELPAIYNLADCFVYPSLYEAFGLAGVEAMACGCPVAGARAAAIPEVLGDAAALFDPYSPEDMARSILSIVRDPPTREACVRKGLERARFFTWERAATETLQLFHGLVDRKK
jgi:glycosyltransferase involved in cell wall biosynthesis